MGRKAGFHHLNEVQKKLAADNIGLVWWFMKKSIKNGSILPEELD
ncbi:hypothetical protein LCGC14_1527260, partial [marine sediment metagenome]